MTDVNVYWAGEDRAKVNRLQAAMTSLPQIELHTNHYFADGMYARELIHPAGAVVVGKVHKKEHFFILTKGSLQVTVDEEAKELTAPCVLVSKPGTKRALFSLDGCVYMTVHKTKRKSLDRIEAELVEHDPASLFDSGNKLRALK